MINIHYTKTHLSRILERVQTGEDIIIARAGKPIAKIIAFNEKLMPRKPGSCKGKIKMAKDFDELPKDILDSFYNSSL